MAAKAGGARRVDQSSVWRHAGYRTMAEWMAAKTGDPVGAVVGLLDTATRVRQAARSAEDETARHARLRARRFARTRTDTDGLVIVHAGFAPQDWAPFADRLRRGTDAIDWVRDLLPDAIVHALVHDGVDITTYAPIRKRTGPRPLSEEAGGAGAVSRQAQRSEHGGAHR